MSSWAVAWGINGLLVMGVLYLFAFAGSKDKKILHIATLFFLALAMWGTFPSNGCN